MKRQLSWRCEENNADLLKGFNLQDAEDCFGKLQEHLKRQAQEDLFRRLMPEFQAWQEHWDNEDDPFESEESLSEEEEEREEEEIIEKPKHRRLMDGFVAGPVEATVWDKNKFVRCDAKIVNTNADGSVVIEWKEKNGITSRNSVESWALERPSHPDDRYPSSMCEEQALMQGDEGFNQAVQAFYSQLHWSSPSQGDISLLPPQEFVTSMMHPLSRVSRLLVDHAVGSGKTLILVRSVCNFYNSGKAIVVIMPKDCVVYNFYRSMWEWPSRWRDFACIKCPDAAAIAAGGQDWKIVRHMRWKINGDNAEIQCIAQRNSISIDKVVSERLVKTMRETLELKGAVLKGKMKPAWLQDFWNKATGTDVHPPAAPLRCYRMTSAGGRASEIVNGEPRGAIFKFGFSEDDNNPFSRKIVFIDEAHNIVRETQTWQEQLMRLRKCLTSARDCTLMALTGSMAERNIQEGRDLMNIVKGDLTNLSDEGFMSSYTARGSNFPQQLPFCCADGEFQRTRKVEFVKTVPLSSYALVRYVYQAIKVHRSKKPDNVLANHTNMPVYFGALWASDMKEQILNGKTEVVPKFASVIADIKKYVELNEKCVVMINRKTGYGTFVQILQNVASCDGFQIALLKDIETFNSTENTTMVMVLDSDVASESVDLKNVRHHLLVDVPQSLGSYQQMCGRSVRCESHVSLPLDQRNVKFVVYCAVFPDFDGRNKDLAGFALWMFCGYCVDSDRPNLNLDPAPRDIIEAVQEFLRCIERHNVTTINQLTIMLQRENTRLPESLRQSLNIPSLLLKRLMVGLYGLQKHGMKACPDHLSSTIDERLVDKLCLDAERMTPALMQMRQRAMDSLYY